MSDRRLSIYLNDHLTGARGALSHLERMIALAHGNSAASLRQLHDEISKDRDQLELLIRELGVTAGTLRSMAGKVGQKLSVPILRLRALRRPELEMLESLDLLSSGVAGKRALWESLERAGEEHEKLRILPYPILIERAEQQLETVRELRKDHAVPALL